jgi:hypothetical protein
MTHSPVEVAVGAIMLAVFIVEMVFALGMKR